MPHLGSLYIGGDESGVSLPCDQAVGFSLREPARLFRTFTADANWQVEIATGHRSIVARWYGPSLGDEELLQRSHDTVQRFCDLLCYERQERVALVDPWNSPLLYSTGKLQWNDAVIWPIRATMQMSIRHADGTEEVVSEHGDAIKWHPALRFYRLSQTAADIYEAYRNLYLAVEACLDLAFPKQPQEREREWLESALRRFHAVRSLEAIVPKRTTDPVAYIVGTQYGGTRIELFHSKQGSIIVPHDGTTGRKVATAYKSLVRLWNELARAYIHRPRITGAFANAGLTSFAETAVSRASMSYSSDPAAPRDTDTILGPADTVAPFDTVNTEAAHEPGAMTVIGSRSQPRDSGVEVAFKVGVSTGDVLSMVSYVSDGIHFGSTDAFRSVVEVLFVDADAARQQF